MSRISTASIPLPTAVMCPHGSPLGSCPACKGGGGAGQLSWNECFAQGLQMKQARDLSQGMEKAYFQQSLNLAHGRRLQSIQVEGKPGLFALFQGVQGVLSFIQPFALVFLKPLGHGVAMFQGGTVQGVHILQSLASRFSREMGLRWAAIAGAIGMTLFGDGQKKSGLLITLQQAMESLGHWLRDHLKALGSAPGVYHDKSGGGGGGSGYFRQGGASEGEPEEGEQNTLERETSPKAVVSPFVF